MYQFEQSSLTSPFGFHPPQAVTADCYNRTGAALAKGEVAVLDVLGEATETTTWREQGPASAWTNLVPVTTARLDSGLPLVIANEAIADDAYGSVSMCIGYVAEALVGTDNGATLTASAGDYVYFLNGATYCNIAGTTGEYVAGLVLEDVSVGGTGAGNAQLLPVMFLWSVMFTAPTA